MTGLIVHEWIEANGGAEKVVSAMVEAFPDAPVLALWDDAPGSLGAGEVRESWLARTPLRRHKIAALPLLPLVWRSVVDRSRPVDWALVSSHLFAHHVRLPGLAAGAPKLVYAHTPARYLWTPDLDPRGSSLPVRGAAAALKPLDRARAGEARAIAANSTFVAERIARTWHREAEVIHPPVDVTEIQSVPDWSVRVGDGQREVLEALPETFLLGASRMVTYKRLDRVIRAGELVGVAVVLAGGGPEEPALRARAATASVPVHFVGRPDDTLLRALYQRCSAFVFLPVEDFGIMPVEALAAGAPVVVHRLGGAAESLALVGQRYGACVDPDDEADLAAGLAGVLARGTRVPPEVTRAFSRERFVAQIRDFVARHVP